MTRPEKIVNQLSVVTMIFRNVSSVFRCITCTELCLSILSDVYATYVDLFSILHCLIHYKAIVIFQYLTKLLLCTIVFVIINNIKGN